MQYHKTNWWLRDIERRWDYMALACIYPVIAPNAKSIVIKMLQNYTYLPRAHEEQMFHGVSHSPHIIFVAEVSYIDVHSRAGLVGFGIVNKEYFKLVG
jgi:hypothetical protein